MDERTIAAIAAGVDALDMQPALVHCSACGREWHSETMADGLRDVGACPRCGGALVFAGAATTPVAAPGRRVGDDDVAPHLVLGVPRR